MNTIGENAFSEHLDTSKYSPILVCVDSAPLCAPNSPVIPKQMRENAVNVDYGMANLLNLFKANPKLNAETFIQIVARDKNKSIPPQIMKQHVAAVLTLKAQKALVSGSKLMQELDHPYIISGVDERSKFSERYLNCLGFIGVGQSKTSGKQISFLGHLDSRHIISNGTESLQQDLKMLLKRLLTKSVAKSIDFVIFGGQIGCDQDENQQILETTEFLAQRVQNILGFDPISILRFGAYAVTERDPGQSVFFNTQKRQMYSFRRLPHKGIYALNHCNKTSDIVQITREILWRKNAEIQASS